MQMSRGPIFIAGLERSGTSLLYALLASHPNIAMTRRTNLWTYFYNQYGDLGKPENFEKCLSVMMRYKRLIPLHLNVDELRRDFPKGEMTYPRLFTLIEEQYARRLGRPRWGDKSLNTERYADQIFEAYPNAYILHIIRDPRDRYASALARWKVSRGGAGGGSAEWLSSFKLAQRNLNKYPENYMIVRYETLASQPKKTMTNICSLIGEEYKPVMLAMKGAEEFSDEGGNSSYGQFEAGTISTRSIGRYHKVLSARQIAFMQKAIGSRMTQLDYEMDRVKLSAMENVLFFLFDIPLNSARMFAWRLRESFLNQIGRSLPSYRIVRDSEQAGASA
jgi:hypothetical protein